MGRRQGIKAAALLVAVGLLLAGCGAGAVETAAAPQQPAVKALALWAPADAPLVDVLAGLVARYNDAAPETAVTLRCFDTQAAMLAALEDGRPELLLCTQETMPALSEKDALTAFRFDAASAPQFLAPFAAQETVQAGRFVPLCAEIPVLVCREEGRARLAGCGTLEALFAAASETAVQQERATLAIDDCAGLFALAMAQRGEPFSARLETEHASQSYREVYNLFAGAVFDGALARTENETALALLEQGAVDAALCASRALAGRESAGLALLPLPPMDGCQALAEAELWGLAATAAAEKAEAAADFAAWLCRVDETALQALRQGYVPAVHGAWEREQTGLAAALGHTAAAYDAFLPPPGDEARTAREQFSQALWEALARLEESW